MYNLISDDWFVVPNDLVGGWAIALSDKPMSELVGREPVVVDDVATLEVARYIVALHNHRRRPHG